MRQEFRDEDKVRLLLWCDRHCCLCEKACGVDIEIAHLPGAEESSDPNDAIPLCYDCHAKIGHYNPDHPRGNKYKAAELRARREQIYERYTWHLVPPVEHRVTQRLLGGNGSRTLPDVGFNLIHHGDSLPARVVIAVDVFLEHRRLGFPKSDLYRGDQPWNLNPRVVIGGHFELPDGAVGVSGRLEIRVNMAAIDQYDRRHDQLPMSWIFIPDENHWFVHPVPPK